MVTEVLGEEEGKCQRGIQVRRAELSEKKGKKTYFLNITDHTNRPPGYHSREAKIQ